MTTKTVSCTKNIRRTVELTRDGPVEKMEEVLEGGPECQGTTDRTKGGMTSFFPGVRHTSSSSSSLTTMNVHDGGAKGIFLGDSKSSLAGRFGVDLGKDLGAFFTDGADDDVPDFHARSVKSSRPERQADYVGTGTKRSEAE